MAKPFLSYEEQLNKLTDEKKLIINNSAYAVSLLKNIGYFALIGGYKTLFINPMTRIYQNGTAIEDIYALYSFDADLRELIFKYICIIERKICQLISYSFCREHGERQEEYLNFSNYNNTSKNHADIAKLISILDFQANRNNERPYLVHQRSTYHNVPLWIVINTLTFGQISKFYSLLPYQIQSEISKEYKHVKEKELKRYLKILTLFRNVCAHNERLFSFRIQIDFPDTVLHKKLNIPKNGNQYINGKRDLFGLVIAFRYLLSKEDFFKFKCTLKHHIDKYCSAGFNIGYFRLLNMMGFPQNWEHITRYKV